MPLHLLAERTKAQRDLVLLLYANRTPFRLYDIARDLQRRHTLTRWPLANYSGDHSRAQSSGNEGRVSDQRQAASRPQTCTTSVSCANDSVTSCLGRAVSHHSGKHFRSAGCNHALQIFWERNHSPSAHSPMELVYSLGLLACTFCWPSRILEVPLPCSLHHFSV